MENIIKKDVYQVTYLNIPLTIINITSHILLSKPRKRWKKEESSQFFLGKINILNLNRHWRSGEYISELQYLSNPDKVLDLYYSDCLKSFINYCQDPLEFLNSDGYFKSNMSDFWCYNNLTNDCLEDFISVYNKFNNTNLNIDQLLKIDPKFRFDNLKFIWQKTFNSDPTFADLIDSKFLVFEFHPLDQKS